jgi:hypothetical protein
LPENLRINKFITTFVVQKSNKKGGVTDDMNKKKRLIYRILDLLAMIENKKNQPIVNQIKGLLFELLNS